MKMIAIMFMLLVHALYSNEAIVSEMRLECHEDGKLAQKWVGMLHLEPNNNWMKYTIFTENEEKIGVEHWIAMERNTEMRITNVKTADNGESISFEIVYPLNRGSLKFEGKKRDQSSTIVYDLRGVGIIKWAILEGATNMSLTTSPAMKVAGKEIYLRL
jgi:hypothetical protein